MIRPVLALERLLFLEPEGKVGYQPFRSDSSIRFYIRFPPPT